jgi:hypothetical protein
MRKVIALALFVGIIGAAIPMGSTAFGEHLLPTWRPSEVPDTAMADADITLAMKAHATPAQVGAVTRAIRRGRGVIRYAHLSSDDAEAQLLMRQQLFRIDTYEGIKTRNIRREFAALEGVDDAWLSGGRMFTDVVRRLAPCPDPGFELVVSMRVDAADVQVDAVRALLSADPRLVLVTETDPTAASAALRRNFPGKYPDARAHHFGTSFAVHTAPDVDNMFVQELWSLAGVDGTTTSEIGCEALAAHVGTASLIPLA